MASVYNSAHFQLRLGLKGTIKQFFQSAGADALNRQELHCVGCEAEIEGPFQRDAELLRETRQLNQISAPPVWSKYPFAPVRQARYYVDSKCAIPNGHGFWHTSQAW